MARLGCAGSGRTDERNPRREGAGVVRRLASIQYMRALAVLLVVAFHLSIRIPDAFPPEALKFLRVGGAGVDLFFVISGFIMWTISEGRATGPAEFMLRRISRIVPMYWLATLAWCAIAAVGITAWVKLTPEHVVKSLFFVPHYNPSYPDEVFPVLVPGWTLNYEMFFYLIFALCLFLPARLRLAGLVGALGGLVIAGWLTTASGPIAATYTSPLLLEFLAGVAIGHCWRRGLHPRGATAAACLTAGLAALVYAGATGIDEDTQRVLYWGAPSVLIVIGALGVRPLAVEHGRLLLIGDASYSIYLTHLFGLTFLDIVWSRVPMLPGSPLEIPVFFAIGAGLSLTIGIMAYRLAEQPLEAAFRMRLLARGPGRAPARRS